MTVADNTSRNQYTATPSQALFAYTFEIVDKDDIVVLINGIPLSEGTDYTVTGVGSDTGGNIVLTSGTTGGNIVTIYRDMPYSRTQNYTNSGDFLASEVNSDFDNLWLAGEQTNRAFSQSIRKPIIDSDSISMELPKAVDRADTFLTFDSNGAVSVQPVDDGINPATITRDQFTGDGSTTLFTLTSSKGNERSVVIYIDGVYQESDSYNIAGFSLTFTEAPPLNSSIEVLLFKVYDITNIEASDVSVSDAGGYYTSSTVEGALQEVGADIAEDDPIYDTVTALNSITVNEVTFDGTDGTSGQFLTTDGSGNLSFATATDTGITAVVEDTTPQLGGDLASNGNDILFADNDKAIFGAGSDLQIYHDGSQSLIHDAGTGPLKVRGSGLQINNAADTEQFLQASENGAVTVFYDGSAKLATSSTGIDVTGNATFDDNGRAIFGSGSDLQIYHDGSNSFISETGTGYLGIGTNGSKVIINKSPFENMAEFITDGAVNLYYNNVQKFATTSTGIDVTGNLTVDAGSNGKIEFGNITTNYGRLYADSTGTFVGSVTADPLIFRTTNTDRMRIDSSGNVGIGTDLPDQLVHLYASNPILNMEHFQNGSSRIYFESSTDGNWGAINASNASGNRKIAISPSSATGDTRFGGLELSTSGATIGGIFDTDYGLNVYGNVGIGGATSALAKLDVLGGALGGTSGNSVDIATLRATTSNVDKLNITAERLSTGTDWSSAGLRLQRQVDVTNMGYMQFGNDISDLITFGESNTEYMRIDGSGNLLVGHTTTAGPGAGNTVEGLTLSNSGTIWASRDSSYAANFNRNGTDGKIVYFRNDGVVAGSVTLTGATTVSFDTSSDERLKENIANADDAGLVVDAIQVRKFDWIADGKHQRYGMVAQELNTIAPEAVTMPDDPEEMAGVDYSKLVPMLVKEIQSLRARVAQLEND